MDGRAARRQADFAGLLHAVALASAADADGRVAWETLTALVTSEAAPGSMPAGSGELEALRLRPVEPLLAENLARVLIARADAGPRFRRALDNWRRRKGVQAVRRAASTPGGQPQGTVRSSGLQPEPKPWYRRLPACPHIEIVLSAQGYAHASHNR